MQKFYLFFIAIASYVTANGQDFNSIITKTADTLSKKITASKKLKIAITDFVNIDESVTQLGTFLSNEVSSELANLTENQTKFRVLERANLDQIFKEKHLVSFADPSGLAKELGKIDAADALIFATITDFDGYYRVVLKMLDSRNGDALCSYKVSFVKTPSLENLNNLVVKKAAPTITKSSQEITVSGNNESAAKETGEFCFKNVDNMGYKATVSIAKAGKGDVLKSITVNHGETNCMYELASGIYTVSVSWGGNWGPVTEAQTAKYEIKVKSGLSGTLEIQH